VSSPAKRCGKTRLAELLERLTVRGFLNINISEAALFRKIAKEKPTLILDEAETLNTKHSERSGYLLSILQAGFRKGVIRGSPNRGDEMRPRNFVWKSLNRGTDLIFSFGTGVIRYQIPTNDSRTISVKGLHSPLSPRNARPARVAANIGILAVFQMLGNRSPSGWNSVLSARFRRVLACLAVQTTRRAYGQNSTTKRSNSAFPKRLIETTDFGHSTLRPEPKSAKFGNDMQSAVF
jgi:hypothetical protein